MMLAVISRSSESASQKDVQLGMPVVIIHEPVVYLIRHIQQGHFLQESVVPNSVEGLAEVKHMKSRLRI